MMQLLAVLSHAVEGSAFIALGASFIWGVLSIILSPCHLASIPLIVGFVNGQGRMPVRRAFGMSALFAFGILVTIALIGLVTAMAGRLLGDLGMAGKLLVAGVFILVGLHLLGVVPMPWAGAANVKFSRKGAWAALVLGLVFGVALGPCTFAFMAPVLGVVMRTGAANMGYGVLLLAAYGLGHCLVIVLAGTFTEVVQRYLNWNEQSKGSKVLRKICGVLVVLGGVYLAVVP